MHHFDSWIKRDQLDVTCFIISLFNAQRVSGVNTSILRSLRLICWVISWVVLFWFDVCWCYVVVWLWWCSIRMQAEALLQPAYNLLVPIGWILKPRKEVCVKTQRESYVYWTVHHLDNWIKRDQLDVTCFIISLFNAQQVSGVNTSILRSLRLICWVILWVVLFWFDVCWCYVVVWLSWCGIRMQAEALVPQPAYHNVTPTHIELEQYNPWNNSTNKSQAPEDGCINIRNLLRIK